jgi:RNA polymerase sigma-70 factor (ECF subfamily)
MRRPETLVTASNMELQDADDVTLVRALQDKDPRAARVLWERYATTVHRILRRALGPSSDVEDMAQEVFLTVFRKASTIRSPAALRAYIMSVAALSSRSELRKRWAHRLSPYWGTSLAESTPATQDTGARAALLHFYTLLSRLRPSHRTAFVLRFMEGLDYAQVASALGVSLATAKRWVARGAAKVQLLVERDPVLVEFLGRPKLRPDRAPISGPPPLE